MFESCLFSLLGIYSPSRDHLGEVVLSVVRDNVVPTRLLDVENFNLEVVAVGDTETSRDVELLQALADVLELSVRHLRIQLVAEGRSDEEKSWHDLRLLVEAASITHISVFVVFRADHEFE